MAHLDPEVLAEFDAGLITGRRGAQISAHLAACEQCTALGEQLAGVSALFMAVPAATMPDRLAERLDTVLAAEIARRDQTESAGAQLAGEPGGKGSRDRERRPRPSWHRNLRPLALRVLAPVAVIALIVAGALELTPKGSTSSETSSSAASSAASAPDRSAAGGPAAAQSSSAASGAIGANRPAAAPLKTAPTAFPVVTGTVNFAPGSFKQQVEAALRVPASERQTQTSTTTIRACVQALAGSAARPVLVESARYQGQPATLVVLRTGSGDTAWMAGSRCSATDHDLLDRTTVPSGISGP